MLKMPTRVQAESSGGAKFKIATDLVNQLEKENNISLPPKLKLFLTILAFHNASDFVEIYEITELLMGVCQVLPSNSNFNAKC